MKNETVLSIIIPVYNSEKYIGNLLENLFKQNNDKRMEVIIINDGSTDKTEEIIKKILKLKYNIKYYYQQNKGVSSARNYGLKCAKGNFVWFIDSDDSIPNDTISNFFDIVSKYTADELNKIDFFQSYYLLYENNKLIEPKKRIGIKLSDDNYNTLSLCSNIISKRIINERKINEKLKYTEDMDFMLEIINDAKVINNLNFAIYIYDRTNEDSATKKITEKRIIDLLYFIEKWEKRDVNNFLKKKEILQFVSYQYYILMGILSNYEKIEKNQKKIEMLDTKIYEKKYLIKYCKNTKGKLVNIVYHMFGYKITKKIMGVWLKIK